jgi:opacity protein-like surface antigen
LVAAIMPASLDAQVQFSAGVFGGAFIPTTDLSTQGSSSAADYKYLKLKTGWTVGGRAAIWITPRLAIEGEGAYVGSNLEIFNQEGGTVLADTSFTANMFYGSLNLMYLLIAPAFEPISVYLAGGVGFVGRSSSLYDSTASLTSTSNVAGTLGLGIRYGVARSVLIRADIRDYIYSYKEEQFSPDSKLQNDLLISAGVEYVFGG